MAAPQETTSYWQASSAPFNGATKDAPEGKFDVAIIGGGFTGLSAGLALSKLGAKVAILETKKIMGAASGRNGGQCNAGTAHDFGALCNSYGIENAKKWYKAHCDAVDTVERIAIENQIDCAFSRCGRVKLAAKPQHFKKLIASHELLVREIDANVSIVPPENIKSEIGSDQFFGALIQHTSAQLHVGKFGAGLAEAAIKNGAIIWENEEVQSIQKQDGTWEIKSRTGAIFANQILIATGGASPGKPFAFYQRRIVSVGSFAIATAPLPQNLVDELFPNKRNYVTSRIIGNYFRLAPDNSLIFGGRAKFSNSNPKADIEGAKILETTMHEMFPALKGIEIGHKWGGTIDLTADRLPRAGEHEGIFYSMGYSGHGVQMAVHMGQQMANYMNGDQNANPFKDLDWPAIPGHFGNQWFLPLVGIWFKWQDWLN